MSREIRVGLFVFIGAVLLVGGILSLGEIRLEKGYQIHILFNDIGGLLPKATVRIAGVEVGKVKEITLEANKAKVTVWLKRKITLYKDARASIITAGVIGIKYLEMTRGTPGAPVLKDEDVITGIDPISFDYVVNQTMKSFDQLVLTLQSLTAGGEVPQNINLLLKDLRTLTVRVNEFFAEENEQLHTTVGNVSKLSKGLIHLTDRVNTFTEKLEDLVTNVGDLTTESKKEMKTTLSALRTSTDNLNKVFAQTNRFLVQVSTSAASKDTALGKVLVDPVFANELQRSVTTFTDLLETIKKRVEKFKF